MNKMPIRANSLSFGLYGEDPGPINPHSSVGNDIDIEYLDEGRSTRTIFVREHLYSTVFLRAIFW
jgi:hypothetical protein